MRLDLQILKRTVAQVLTGAGVSAPGEATMARFSGSAPVAGGGGGDGGGEAR